MTGGKKTLAFLNQDMDIRVYSYNAQPVTVKLPTTGTFQVEYTDPVSCNVWF
jgi:hypothetical protein